MTTAAPTAILLDLDGTIADSIPIFYALSCEVFEVAGIPAPSFEAHRAAMAEPGSPIDRLFPADFPDRAAFFAKLYQERWTGWLERYEREAQPIPGACDALRTLRRAGLSLAIVTSSLGALSFLDRWAIRELFVTIVQRGDVEKIKPDPEPLVLALRRLERAASAALHVGDSPLDAIAGVAAGTPTIGVLTGVGREADLLAAGAVHVLPALADLPDALPGFLGGESFARVSPRP
ncbi:MAG: HAD family hydrolase [Candidatus Binatia bacterium]